ncbi:hypothetical protein EB796_024810 [Bugula neritina]|uniref:Neurobeachin alpha-solenoid region domain-containing protein n=1 Tax=Bugula neritina TaxID=10212 RepID=A0A7J7IUG2_BUGNE|nr:hypothetical protein EB796_024810 [Bugula neritina]
MASEADLQDIPLDVDDSDTTPNVPNGKGDSADSNAAPKASQLPDNGVSSGDKLERSSSVVDRIMGHSPGDTLKQLAYLEILMADERESVTDRDVVDAVLNALVGEKFDLENNFLVRSSVNVRHLLKFMNHCSEKLQAEIWSMLSGILRKSRRNLLAFTEAHFIQYILERIDSCSPMIGDLLMDMMTVLAGYSITVHELQLLFTKLKAVDNEWPQCAPKLLKQILHITYTLLTGSYIIYTSSVKCLQQMPARHGPDEFFSFPGSEQAAIALPPMCPQKWPYQLGWSFSLWLCLDPFAGVSIEQEKPFVFW